jgi:hypothetical protein
MHKYLKILLFGLFLFIGCEDSTTNNYYDSKENEVIETEWGHDSKIGGTSISDTTYINWKIVTILDEQETVCSFGSESYSSCSDFLPYIAGMDRRFQFHKDGSFTFEKLENIENDEGYNSLGTESGTWQTMNGLLELNLTNSTAMNSTANYFFHNRTYNYETNVGSRQLKIYDSQTEITFEVVFDD